MTGAGAIRPSTNDMRLVLLLGALHTFSGQFQASFGYQRMEELECYVQCKAVVTATNQALSVFSAVVIGRMSDRCGRAPTLGLVCLIQCVQVALTAQFPNRLAHQVVLGAFSTLGLRKALICDYALEMGANKSERAHYIGLLTVKDFFGIFGLVAGLGFGSFQQATWAKLAVKLPTLGIFLVLRRPKVQEKQATLGLRQLLNLPILRTPAVLYILLFRFACALGYHLFETVWPVLALERFPFLTGQGWLAFTHVTFVASSTLGAACSGWIRARFCQLSPAPFFVFVVASLFGSRFTAYFSYSFPATLLALSWKAMIVAPFNTIFAALLGEISPMDQLGGLYGIHEGVENLAGVLGPSLAGLLNSSVGNSGIMCVLFCLYTALFPFLIFGYRRFVTPQVHATGAPAGKKGL